MTPEEAQAIAAADRIFDGIWSLVKICLAPIVFYVLIVIPFQIRAALVDMKRIATEQNEAIQRISEQLDWRNNNR